MLRIDCHTHLLGDHEDTKRLLDELDLKIMNVCVAHGRGPWRPQAEEYIALATRAPDRFAWCTAFDLPNFEDPAGYATLAIGGLERDFTGPHAAIACKIWKNIGMDVKDPAGRFVMPDDPIFDPIYAYLADAGKPLVAHLAEPLACWQPLEPDNPHYDYYSRWPQWHMFGKPDVPSHGQIMAARDHVLEKHPRLHVIGAHLASLEHDVAELAWRFDRYPNFVADTSARILDLARQDRRKVRQFFIDYADRLLFGTDIVSRQSHAAMTPEDRARTLGTIHDRYLAEFAYFASNEPVVIRGRQVRGLGLPDDVLEKLFLANSGRWIPGL